MWLRLHPDMIHASNTQFQITPIYAASLHLNYHELILDTKLKRSSSRNNLNSRIQLQDEKEGKWRSRHHIMKAMELSLAKRLHMSSSREVITSLGRAMLRWSSWSHFRRRTMRRHGTKTIVSGMTQTPSSTTSIAVSSSSPLEKKNVCSGVFLPLHPLIAISLFL